MSVYAAMYAMSSLNLVFTSVVYSLVGNMVAKSRENY